MAPRCRFGDIGPEAALSVMEGSDPFKRFAGPDAVPLALNTTKEEIVELWYAWPGFADQPGGY